MPDSVDHPAALAVRRIWMKTDCASILWRKASNRRSAGRVDRYGMTPFEQRQVNPWNNG